MEPNTNYRGYPKWTLQLTFKNNMGASYHMAVDIDHGIARDIQEIKKPCMFDFASKPFENMVEVLKRRVFRKDMFVREATRLGGLLAERMEDAEGWHDESRIEPAKQQLAGRYEY